MRGLRTLLILVGVAAALGAYVYFVESKKPPDGGADSHPKVFSVKSEDIQEITVRAEGGDRTHLRKTNGTWQIVEPVSTAADETEVSSVVSNLATVDNLRTVEEAPTDLKTFGLDPPRVEVSFKAGASQPVQTLLIGDKTATGGDLYARLSTDKKVFLIAAYFDTSFNRTTFDLRSKSVLAFERDKVDRVEMVSGKNVVHLARAGTDWTLAKPITAAADYGTVEGLVGRMQTLQMKALTAQDASDLKPYGLDTPQASIALVAGSARASLLVGSKTDAGTVYAKDEARSLVFTVEATLLDDLNKPADQWRRKDLFAFRAYNATRIDITRGTSTVAYEKVKGQGKDAAEKWRRIAPDAREVDNAAFDTFLTKLANQRASSFVEPNAKTKTGLDQPIMVVTVRFDEGKKEEKVTFGRVGADVYAAIGGQPGAAKIDTTEFDDAVKALDGLK